VKRCGVLKVEPGESHQGALKREIQEELGLVIQVVETLTPVKQGDFTLYPYQCRAISGEMHLYEHEEASWIGQEEGGDLDWAKADLPIWREIIEKSLFT